MPSRPLQDSNPLDVVRKTTRLALLPLPLLLQASNSCRDVPNQARLKRLCEQARQVGEVRDGRRGLRTLGEGQTRLGRVGQREVNFGRSDQVEGDSLTLSDHRRWVERPFKRDATPLPPLGALFRSVLPLNVNLPTPPSHPPPKPRQQTLNSPTNSVKLQVIHDRTQKARSDDGRSRRVSYGQERVV